MIVVGTSDHKIAWKGSCVVRGREGKDVKE